MIIQLLGHFMPHLVRNPPAPLRIMVLLLAILLYGTTGFLYFELPLNPDLSLQDGLWYTIVTMTTVGYGDFFPKTMGGRFLVGWPVMLVGIGLLGYALSLIAAALVTSKTQEVRGLSSFNLRNHLILFNFPALAKVESVIQELVLDSSIGSHTPIVIVDEELESLPAEIEKRGVHYVRGNPTRDDTLSRADIDHARHAIILSRAPGQVTSDHLNVAIALAIEARARSVTTVVECVDAASEELLRKAGCDRIVCTARFEANFISQELLNPGVQGVIGDLMSSSGGGQQFYLVPVSRDGSFSDFSSACRARGHLAVGVSSSGGLRLNVGDGHPVKVGDRLVTIGPTRLESV